MIFIKVTICILAKRYLKGLKVCFLIVVKFLVIDLCVFLELAYFTYCNTILLLCTY